MLIKEQSRKKQGITVTGGAFYEINPKGLGGEELLDENCGVVRVLFREEVAILHRLALHVRSPLPPYAQWTAILCIESVERATLGPQMQHRTFDALGRFLVGTVVLDIDRRRSSIFLTDSMNADRITIG